MLATDPAERPGCAELLGHSFVLRADLVRTPTPRLSTGPAELERICEALAARREPYSVAQLTSFARRLGVGVDALGAALAAAGSGGGGVRGMEVATP